MTETNPTCIGRVRHVLGSSVTVALDPDLAGVTPIWEGRLHSVGQIGSLVRIPQGPMTLLATVTLVGISELTGPVPPGFTAAVGDRWLKVELIGETDGLGRFGRGVTTYPSLDDPVHFTTPRELLSVYPSPDAEHVRLGSLSAATDVPLSLEAARLVTRHSAIVGSTGSGKTSAAARLVQNFASGGWSSANIVVVDPHGEYAAALGEHSSVRSVLSDGESMLRVPFWALPADDILRAFCGAVDSATPKNRFSELVTQERRRYATSADWLDIEPASITADTPIPFNIRNVWYDLECENSATYTQQGGGGELTCDDPGDAESLTVPVFQTYGLGNAPPFKGPLFGAYGSVPDRLRHRLLDSRLRFFLEPDGDGAESDPLLSVLNEWLGNEQPVSVLDFSGVPFEATDLAVGVVLQLLFELAVRSTTTGIGRPRPVLVVLEEAHRYLGEGPSVRLARESANRIAKEGRKYGVGLMLATQRPSELPDTALSQVGSVIALRLTNARDQGAVKAALPDAVSGLADVLPSLRTGEAIVSGEAVKIPSRVLIDAPVPAPNADDPSLDSWRGELSMNQLEVPLTVWRGQTDSNGGGDDS